MIIAVKHHYTVFAVALAKLAGAVQYMFITSILFMNLYEIL